MKKYLCFLLIVMLALAMMLAACGSEEPATEDPAVDDTTTDDITSDTDQYEEMTIKFQVSGTEQGVDYLTGQQFADAVYEATDGKIEIELYASNILSGGLMSEAMNALTMGGAYEMGIFSSAVLSQLDPHFLVVQLPFIFEDYADVSSYHDSTGGEWIKGLMSEYGIVYLGAEHNGLKQWTNNEEEKHAPADFENFKIRIPGGEVSTMTWQALGADPVAMSWSEVYTALQQGTVDGHENSYQTIYSNNIQEVQKYITEAYYQYDGYWMMYSADAWDQLNEATQELFMELGDEACLWGRAYLEDSEVTIKEELVANGNIINVLTPEERQAFVDATSGVIDHFRDVYGDEAYAAWGIGE